MKSEIQKLAGLTRKLSIEVPPEVVNAALSKMYEEVRRAASFKGFRPGKAPLDMVKAQYKAKVESDVAAKIIEDHYGKAINEHSLQPVNYPEIEFEGLKEGEPLKFSAVFEIRPDVPLNKYKGLEAQKEKAITKPEVIDSILQDIRKSKAKLIPLIELRPAQKGDTAVLDFKGTVDGKDLPGGSGQEFNLELGSNQFIPGFEDGLVGMNPGESRALDLKFPDDYHGKDVAGKAVHFDVTLKEIKKSILPDLDDEFAKTLGSHESLAHLREEITKDVQGRDEKRIKDDLRNRLLHTLVENNPFEVPRSMMIEQKKLLIDDLHHRMENEGMPHDQFEEYKKKWDKDFEKSAEFVIRSSLLVNAIAKTENLFATDADFDQKMDAYAKQSGIEIEKLRAFYSKPENKSRLRFQVTEERVMAFLLEHAKISEVTPDKLKKLDE